KIARVQFGFVEWRILRRRTDGDGERIRRYEMRRLRIEKPARDRCGQLPLFHGRPIHLWPAPARAEERDVASRRIDQKPLGAEVERCRQIHLEDAQAVEMEIEFGNVVSALETPQLAEVRGVSEIIERAVNDVTDSGRAELR